MRMEPSSRRGLRPFRVITGLIGVVVLLFVSGGVPGRVAAQPPIPAELPSQKPSAVRGKAVFDARCTRCHGPQGQGDGPMVAQLPTPPPSFADVEHMRQVTPAAYFDVITNGNLDALMPPWGNALSAQERWDVVFYVWSLGTSGERVQAGQEVYGRECLGCHGEDGTGIETADLSDLRTTVALSQADLARAVREGHADREWKDNLTDDERWAVVDYVRTLAYEPIFAALAARGDGVIQGRLVQGTPGGPTEFAGLPVTVFPFVGDTPLTPITVTTQADGTFIVTDLPTGDDRSYGLRVEYAGVEYFHPGFLTFTDDTTVSANVTVYETTPDDAAIHVERHHIIIDFAEGAMQVAELYVFRNAGDRTFVGDGETLRFPLPSGAVGLRFDDARMQASTRLTEGGVVDTLPVPPGARQVLLSYSLPYQGSSATFEKEVVYPTANLNVLVADVGAKVTAEAFTAGEPVTTQGNARFLNFTRSSVAAGSRLELQLSDLPRGGEASRAVAPDRSAVLRWVGVGLAILAMVFGVLYPTLRSRLVFGEESSVERSVLRRRRQMLLQEIADLDDALEAGELAEAEHRRTRAELKAELIEIMQQLRVSKEGQV